jgi:protein-L-isoaspartate O-methyltransferase
MPIRIRHFLLLKPFLSLILLFPVSIIEIKKEHKVLEIGTGSGYQTAVYV